MTHGNDSMGVLMTVPCPRNGQNAGIMSCALSAAALKCTKRVVRATVGVAKDGNWGLTGGGRRATIPVYEMREKGAHAL